MDMCDIIDEYKNRIRRLEHERDLYRERAIGEVSNHHAGATHETATFDVDLEVMRHLQGAPSWR